MIIKSDGHLYKAFGLKLLSQIEFPELIMGDERSLIDVTIILDAVIPQEECSNKYHFKVCENEVSFVFPGVATFIVQEGKTIIVSPFGDGKEGQIRLLILGTCMGIILLQRGILPLHGSCVVIDNKAYAIVGETGAGKSTLATAFKNKGYKLLTDDVIAVTFDLNDHPYVIPSYPQQKLWENSLIHLGMSVNDYTPLFERENKFAIPVHGQFLDASFQLAGMYHLEKTQEDKIEIKKADGIEKIEMLYLNTYRNFLVPQLNQMDWHFKQSIKIINSNIIYKIKRPTKKFTADEITNLILNTIKGGNLDVHRPALIK